MDRSLMAGYQVRQESSLLALLSRRKVQAYRPRVWAGEEYSITQNARAMDLIYHWAER